MTRYTLPDGTEVTLNNGIRPALDDHKWVHHPALGLLSIHEKHLTEALQSAPEPTADGTFVTVRSEGTKTYAFSRREAINASMFPERPAEYCWWWHDGNSWLRWEDVLRHGDPVELVVDPADSAPELPWQMFDDPARYHLRISRSDTGQVEIHPSLHSAFLDAAECVTVAAVLLRAAREARNA